MAVSEKPTIPLASQTKRLKKLIDLWIIFDDRFPDLLAHCALMLHNIALRDCVATLEGIGRCGCIVALLTRKPQCSRDSRASLELATEVRLVVY